MFSGFRLRQNRQKCDKTATKRKKKTCGTASGSRGGSSRQSTSPRLPCLSPWEAWLSFSSAGGTMDIDERADNLSGRDESASLLLSAVWGRKNAGEAEAKSSGELRCSERDTPTRSQNPSSPHARKKTSSRRQFIMWRSQSTTLMPTEEREVRSCHTHPTCAPSYTRDQARPKEALRKQSISRSGETRRLVDLIRRTYLDTQSYTSCDARPRAAR